MIQCLQQQEIWKKPDKDWMRINFGSIVSDGETGGALGITAMNDQGNVINAWAVAREGLFTPVAADLEAIRCALILAQQQGWRRIEMKVDVKAMVCCLQKQKSPTLETLTIAEDIYILEKIFEDCRFDYEHRKYNRKCASLASFALEHKASYGWSSSFLDWLSNIV